MALFLQAFTEGLKALARARRTLPLSLANNQMASSATKRVSTSRVINVRKEVSCIFSQGSMLSLRT